MQIILLDKILNLGKLGDRVYVRAGYARNFLIPQGKAVRATKENIEYFKHRRIELESKLNNALIESHSRAEKIKLLNSIIIKSKAGEGGKLFGSVNTRDIAAAVTAAGVEVNKKEVRLLNGAIRNIGEHEVGFQLHNEVFTKLVIKVVNDH